MCLQTPGKASWAVQHSRNTYVGWLAPKYADLTTTAFVLDLRVRQQVLSLGPEHNLIMSQRMLLKRRSLSLLGLESRDLQSHP